MVKSSQRIAYNLRGLLRAAFTLSGVGIIIIIYNLSCRDCLRFAFMDILQDELKDYKKNVEHPSDQEVSLLGQSHWYSKRALILYSWHSRLFVIIFTPLQI